MREITIEHEQINRFLSSGPKIPMTERPLFKLVWSDDAYELRTGTYRVFESGVFIREETITKQVLKYSWLKECYVLEQWFPPQLCMLEELPDSDKGSYEPIYVFADAAGNTLPLNPKVVEFIVQQAMKPQKSSQLLKSVIDARMDAREQQLDDQNWDLLNDEGPLVSQFHDGSAILNAYDAKFNKPN